MSVRERERERERARDTARRLTPSLLVCAGARPPPQTAQPQPDAPSASMQAKLDAAWKQNLDDNAVGFELTELSPDVR